MIAVWSARVRATMTAACVGAGAVLMTGVGATWTATEAQAKTPGKTYCFRGICHRILTLAETSSRLGRPSLVQASFYDHCRSDRFNPCGLTSSGEEFRAGAADNAASPILPNGTIIMVRNPATRKTAVLRINNAGPYHGNRTLDVSKAAADALGFRRRGVARLEVSIVSAPTPAEASYRRSRVYPPVPGFIGEFASLSAAYASRGAPKVRVAQVPLPSPSPSLESPAIYPQARAAHDPRPLQGNGIERRWLAQSFMFEPALPERKQLRMGAVKLASDIRRAKTTRLAAVR